MSAAASSPRPSSRWDSFEWRRPIVVAVARVANHYNFEVDYGFEEQASIVYKTLAAVDKELQPDKLSLHRCMIHFEAVEAQFLRASFGAFVDLMVLVTKLVEEYGVADSS
ncbi:hypothetical protein PVAP13_6KG265600 [Panicum virgatum]|uniref:Uncharacterized protein n=1 Tax=Panicum virgatum TaxID=38727 RepID=A0A8T0RL10_PANVG|nr:hypothetical protein PVAP13_6KG265600 [Panicum virgatum]